MFIPTVVTDLIYKYWLDLKMQEIGREIRGRYARRLKHVHRSDFVRDIGLYQDWLDFERNGLFSDLTCPTGAQMKSYTFENLRDYEIWIWGLSADPRFWNQDWQG